MNLQKQTLKVQREYKVQSFSKWFFCCLFSFVIPVVWLKTYFTVFEAFCAELWFLAHYLHFAKTLFQEASLLSLFFLYFETLLLHAPLIPCPPSFISFYSNAHDLIELKMYLEGWIKILRLYLFKEMYNGWKGDAQKIWLSIFILGWANFIF